VATDRQQPVHRRSRANPVSSERSTSRGPRAGRRSATADRADRLARFAAGDSLAAGRQFTGTASAWRHRTREPRLCGDSNQIIRYNGHPAVTIGISARPRVNVVRVGQEINARLVELERDRPIGMELHSLYDQPQVVDESVRGFIFDVLLSVA